MNILYTRVSTSEQNADRQLQDVSNFERIYSDSATGLNTARPQLQLMLSTIRSGDSITVHSIDRLARSVTDMIELIKQITNLGCSITFTKESLTFTGDDSPINQLMLNILTSIYKFESDIRKQRQLEGIAIAKSKVIYKGRTSNMRLHADIRTHLSKGTTQKAIAELLNCSISTVKRIKASL